MPEFNFPNEPYLQLNKVSMEDVINKKICSICQYDVELGQTVLQLKTCKHFWCVECTQKFFAASEYYSKFCPDCRTPTMKHQIFVDLLAARELYKRTHELVSLEEVKVMDKFNELIADVQNVN